MVGKMREKLIYAALLTGCVLIVVIPYIAVKYNVFILGSFLVPLIIGGMNALVSYAETKPRNENRVN